MYWEITAVWFLLKNYTAVLKKLWLVCNMLYT
jgi:hypothetical protein